MKIERYPEFTRLALTLLNPHQIKKDQKAYLLKVNLAGNIYFHYNEEIIQLDRKDRELLFNNDSSLRSRFDYHYKTY